MTVTRHAFPLFLPHTSLRQSVKEKCTRLKPHCIETKLCVQAPVDLALCAAPACGRSTKPVGIEVPGIFTSMTIVL